MNVSNDDRQELLALKDESRFMKMIKTAAMVTEKLEQKGIRPVIVGGLSVEIYTRSDYTTRDIDFVLDGREKAKEILATLGFEEEGRYWFHPVLLVSIEIPDHILDGDHRKVTTVKVGKRKVYVIGLEDILFDRLKAAVYWNSMEDDEWGLRLFNLYREDLDLDYLRERVQHEHYQQLTARWKKWLSVIRSQPED